MSLDLWMESKECLTCGHIQSTDSLNYTYNVSPMWYSIFPHDKHMVHIDGMTGIESLIKLNHALSELMKDRPRFIMLNPENGWGSYDSFLGFIRNLAILSAANPNFIWQASR